MDDQSDGAVRNITGQERVGQGRVSLMDDSVPRGIPDGYVVGAPQITGGKGVLMGQYIGDRYIFTGKDNAANQLAVFIVLGRIGAYHRSAVAVLGIRKRGCE